jgi:hypothetical protein
VRKIIAALILVCILSVTAYTQTVYIVNSAAVEGFSITPYDETRREGKITIRGAEHTFRWGYVALFVNGEPVRDDGFCVIGDRAHMEAGLFGRIFGLNVEEKDGAVYITGTVFGEPVTAQVYEGPLLSNSSKRGDAVVIVNGKTQESFAPLHRDSKGEVFIPLRALSVAFGIRAVFSDGFGDGEMMIPRVPHVMLSKYPDGTVPVTAEKALNFLRAQTNTAEAEIKRENDRFYTVGGNGFDYWVDKFTLDIYTFHDHGLSHGGFMEVKRFEP